MFHHKTQRDHSTRVQTKPHSEEKGDICYPVTLQFKPQRTEGDLTKNRHNCQKKKNRGYNSFRNEGKKKTELDK